MIYRILHPNQRRIDADPNILNKHFNITAERLLNSKISYDDTKKAILGLRNDCSTGPDNVPSKFLKLCVDEITSPICHIINTSIKERIFPQQWKISKISPIPKIDHPNTALFQFCLSFPKFTKKSSQFKWFLISRINIFYQTIKRDLERATAQYRHA